jgi:hypothetical protein
MIRPQRTTPTVGESSKIREEGSTSPTPTINDRKDSNNEGNSNNDGRENEQEITDGSKPPKKVIKLYKSPRLTGYLTIFLASVINFHGVVVSKLTDENHGIPSTETQRMYGYIVALVSSVVSGFVLVCHLDRWSCLADTYRDNLFAHKSRFETILDILLLLWWFMAVIIQTRVAGIAGDGKGQFNMYFSTWCCFFCAVSTLESKMIEHNWPSMKTFIKSWPHRAPGWIAILISDFFTLFWYVDVYSEYGSAGDWSNGSQKTYLDFYYKNIRNAQYELLIFVAAATLLPSAAFVFMEIFRVSSDDKKGTLETVIEAVSLFLLACAWVPTVCIATTPGGFASVSAIIVIIIIIIDDIGFLLFIYFFLRGEIERNDGTSNFAMLRFSFM